MKLLDIPQTCFYSWCVAMAFRYVLDYITEQETCMWSSQAVTHTHTCTPILHFLHSINTCGGFVLMFGKTNTVFQV